MTTKEAGSVLKLLGMALAVTPVALFIVLILVTIIETLDMVTKNYLNGRWWIFVLLAYVGSLIYLVCKPYVLKRREKRAVVSALILYWDELVAKQKKEYPSDSERELMREQVSGRIQAWLRFDPELWARHYPDEAYPDYLFGIVDGLVKKANPFLKIVVHK